MKKIILWSSLLAVVFGVNAQAIDRDAKMVDRAQFDFGHLNHADMIGGSIQGETSVTEADGKWAILLGVGAGVFSPDYAPNDNFWDVDLGLKYYLTPQAAVSVLGNYTWLDNGTDRKIAGAKAIGKYRLAPVENAVSPFIKGSLGGRTRSTFSEDSFSEDSVSEFVWELGGGLEFRMNNTFSMVFEGVYSGSDESKDETEDLDGWLGAVSMRYYWF